MMIFSLCIFSVCCSKFYPELLELTTEQFNDTKECLFENLWLYDYDQNRKNFLNDLKSLIFWSNKIIISKDKFDGRINKFKSDFKILAEYTATPELKERLSKCLEFIKNYKKIFKVKETWLNTSIFILMQNDLENRSYEYTKKNVKNIKKYILGVKDVVTKLLSYHDDILKILNATPSHYKLVFNNIDDLCQFSWEIAPTENTAKALINCADVINRLTLN